MSGNFCSLPVAMPPPEDGCRQAFASLSSTWELSMVVVPAAATPPPKVR